MSEGTNDAEETVITDRYAVLDLVEDCGLAGIVAAWEVMDQETWSFISDVAGQQPDEPDANYPVAMALLVSHTSYALDVAAMLSVAGVDLDALWPLEDHHDNHPLRSGQVGIQSLGRLDQEGYRWKLKDLAQVALRVEEIQAGIRANRTNGGGE